MIPHNNSVHLPGISDENFASVVKKKKEEEKKKKKKVKKEPGNLPNLGKHQKQANYTRSQ